MVKHPPGHIEHTDDCMSEWAERARHNMTPATIAANHRLHMFDADVADRAAQFCYSIEKTPVVKVKRNGNVR